MLDPDLLQCFSLVVECGSFTRAAELMNTGQSSVSAKVKRLEELAGRQLLKRTTRGMSLTPDGEVMLSFARDMSALQDKARQRFSGPPLQGAVRLGTSDDFASGGRMAQVLGEFVRRHPRVALEIEVGTSLSLADEMRAGRVDIVLSKRRAADGGGQYLWSEPLVWLGSRAQAARLDEAVPLALFPAPCVYRERALAALTAAGREWRSVVSCPSLAGIRNAVAAGLAVTALPPSLMTRELCLLDGLPEMDPVDFILHCHPRAPAAAHALAGLLRALSPDGQRSGLVA